MFSSRHFQRADFVLIGAALALVAIGCLMIYSCTRTAAGGAGAQWHLVRTQLIWVLLGLAALGITMSVDYMRLPGVYLIVYGVTLVLLVVVLFMAPINGERRWIHYGSLRLQPAEFAQIALVLVIACVASAREHVRDFMSLSKTFLWLVPVIGLIIQDDMGTPVVILGAWFVAMWFVGARATHLAGYAMALVLLFTAAWHFGAVNDYQKGKLVSFLHPDADPGDTGYQQRMGLIAVGNGGFYGRGLFRGPQTGGHWVPEQETDFIFTAVAEELGFLGAAAVLLLFGVVLWRCTVATAEAKDPLGRLVAAGVTAVLGIHVLWNIAMAVGFAPVKGMPLPLVSYGGSSMLATMLAIGLVENVYMRRHKIAF